MDDWSPQQAIIANLQGEISDFQSYNIVIFIMSSFKKKNYKAYKETEKVWPIHRE